MAVTAGPPPRTARSKSSSPRRRNSAEAAEQGNNPEQLFAAGYAACFIGALKAAGAQEKVKVPDDTSITSNVGIGPRSEGGFGLEVALRISLPGMDKQQAEDLVQKAHQICPYSNATRGNIDVRLTVV